jgi:hypothetical protein
MKKPGLIGDRQWETGNGAMKHVVQVENKPNMEKNNMKAVEICTALLLPMWVNPRRPTFSLHIIRTSE